MFKRLFFSIILFIAVAQAYSQNEAYHGGSGDGFGVSTSTSFNMTNVNYPGNELSVTINQAAGQSDPTNQYPVQFTVEFSETVTGFDVDDLEISGTADPQDISISGSGSTYTVEADNISQNGNIIISIPAGSAYNSVGRPNLASTTTDNAVEVTGLDVSVVIDLASNQSAITSNDEVCFSAIFSEAVTGFTSSDVVVEGTANAQGVSISGSGAEYEVCVSGYSGDGTIIISLPAGIVINGSGGWNRTSTNTNNQITVDRIRPGATVRLSVGQEAITSNPIISFDVDFTEDVTGFTNDDILVSGTVTGNSVSISGSGANYQIQISGMQNEGEIQVSVPSNVCTDLAGNYNNSAINESNEVIFDLEGPTVEIMLAPNQPNPAMTLPIKFQIKFSEAVDNFSDLNINFGGSLGITLEVSGSGSSYVAEMNGLRHNETVSISVPAFSVQDIAGNYNSASNNVANSIKYIGPTTTNIGFIDSEQDCFIAWVNGMGLVRFYEFPERNSSFTVYSLGGKKVYYKENLYLENSFPLSGNQAYIVNVKNGDKMHRQIIMPIK